jgi:uncharacterized membrane protein
MDARFTPEGDTGEGLRVIVRPNRTLSLRGMTVLFAGLTVVVLTIGIGFTLAGAWPVLPFAGLELAVVGAVLYRLFRHADDHDGSLSIVNASRWSGARAGASGAMSFSAAGRRSRWSVAAAGIPHN